MIAHSRTISVYAMAVSLEVEAWNGLLAMEEGEVASDANRLRIRSFGKLKSLWGEGGKWWWWRCGSGGDSHALVSILGKHEHKHTYGLIYV